MNVIEKSWYQKFGITWLLLPLSALFYLITLYRFCRKRRLQLATDKPKVIVVGNIAVGGTGKTPFTLFLVDYLQQKGLSVAVISRGYGGQTQSQPLLVTDGISPEICGDEPKLIAVRTGAPVVVCPNRNLSIDYLKKRINPDVIIADDGLQHYQMARAIELCIVDGKRQFGNGFVMPAGPLREAKSRLKHVDLTITNGTAVDNGYQLAVDGVYGIIDGQKVANLDNPVHLVSAIGNPSRFEQSVNEQNILVHGHTIFKDHHTYSESDFAALDGVILMTEKDAVKCQSFAKTNWYYLKVTAKPTKQLVDKLDQLLIEKGIHNHGV
ncbi:Tetraacyldisaccharide 4'-kinase [Pseudoalteromonas sp. P1-9]|uniref:tetraacyldisaccharide 4'-kinase n=1 Tax=Pseudoalteromonas sp. P1-9 TaxID=1710354 RepID=UPI0006D6089F|nr:tetraacyldisaccharide 4'-kinase [Pseudoalteromonas sp. P1-9]KPV94505.1 Tetraacyldisaccharide 4'-kinase [Pseudoalteromonas sp. P1-9]